MKRYREIIKIPKEEVEEIQNILNIREGHYNRAGRDSVIETYSAYFDNGFVADIKVCNGDTPYIDPVLFSPGELGLGEVTTSDIADELIGAYFFYDEGVEYEVVVTTEKEKQEEEYKNINLDTKLKLFEKHGEFYGIRSLRSYFSGFEFYRNLGIENAEIKDLLKELNVDQCFNIFPLKEEEIGFFEKIGEL